MDHIGDRLQYRFQRKKIHPKDKKFVVLNWNAYQEGPNAFDTSQR